jgi:hypothetical protein
LKLKPPSPGAVFDRVRDTEVWKSIFRPGSIFRKGYKDTSRDRALSTMNNVLYHLHPVKMKRHGLKLTYTFCLGGLSFFLFILLTVTGIFLMFFYRPMASSAARKRSPTCRPSARRCSSGTSSATCIDGART